MSDEARKAVACKRGALPNLSEIASYWRESGRAAASFPRLTEYMVEWGCPFCFRCGWAAPTRAAGEYPANWKEERTFDLAWNAAAGWLERAHLQDHQYEGPGTCENLVPLCVLCHAEQPICQVRDEGLDFVRPLSRRWRIRHWLQMATDKRYGGRPSKPGKSKAIRGMLRAQGDVALILAEAAEKTFAELDGNQV